MCIRKWVQVILAKVNTEESIRARYRPDYIGAHGQVRHQLAVTAGSITWHPVLFDTGAFSLTGVVEVSIFVLLFGDKQT